MADKLLSNFKQNIKGLELEPSGGGCFEVHAGGELIYSKLKTGEFPDEQSIVDSVGAKL
ncbi:MAG: Rdx family protein [Planctomycetales bacterium]|nr:Rdx family protein [Planctomycetales bacterium]